MTDLAARLAAVRAERRSPPGETRSSDVDRAAVLARWFGARLEVADGGALVLVERSVPLPARTARALAAHPSTAYVDTETTGLSTGAGTVPFLVAVGRVEATGLVVRQFLLPDYPHEATLLRHVAGEVAQVRRLVSYNGRAFDLPLLVARLTLHGLHSELAGFPTQHDDLLPIARRLWRRLLGSARLAAVEAAVLAVRRVSDCPSSEVPGRYFGYLRDGGPEPLAAVLDHNLQDVASLALLDAELVRLLDGGWRSEQLLDPRGMALELLRHGRSDDALELLVAASGTAPSDGALALRRLASRLLLARGDARGAEELWRHATRYASAEAAEAWVEIARLRERHDRDLRGALEACDAASRILDLAFALGRGGGMTELARIRLRVDARRRRLGRWLRAAERRAARSAA